MLVMTELDTRCLDAFPEWLRALHDDALALAGLLDEERLAEPVRRRIAGALNYLSKSVDLIPDGLEELGYVDDAFVFRVAAADAIQRDSAAARADVTGTLGRLAGEAELIQEFLGDCYPRLSAFTQALEQLTVRGRTADAIATDAGVRRQLVREVRSWTESFTPPTFSRDEKNLVKVKSFLNTKLPE
jgi:uncharacterized membrane protein YkvA (DUF1232 family)